MNVNTTLRDNLTKSINNQLDALAKANHCGAGTLRHDLDFGEMRCGIQSTDRLACEMESIYVLSPAFAQLDTAALETIATQLVNQLTYLEERLVVVEKEKAEMQVRSEKPRLQAANKRSYFELIVGQQGIALHRYEKENAQPRRLAPAVFTRPVFHRLAQDLVQTAAASLS